MVCAGASHAGLGGAAAQLNGQLASRKEAPLSTGAAVGTYRESTLQSGTVVREYLAADSSVFAVSWKGPFLPDLKEILGTHLETMVAASAQPARTSRSQLLLQQSDVMLISGGHMGAFEGKAWIPSKLPAGFTPQDIH